MVVTRFAPSPTGFLHIGGLRTALFSYAWAKHNNGKFILRIEDTDRDRFVNGSIEEIIDVLHRFKLAPDNTITKAQIKRSNNGEVIGFKGDWVKHLDEILSIKDEDFKDVFIQTQRLALYQKYAWQLIKKGLAYFCFCSKERLEKLTAMQLKNKQKLGYDGYCRTHYTLEEAMNKIKSGASYVVRLNVPAFTKYLGTDKITINDVVMGHIEYDLNNVNDQVLIKSDGIPTYHMAVVVDDHLMGVTHILRGAEWISSTPKQYLLYKAFNWEMPQFVHLPVILDPGGGKLSKRKGTVATMEFLKQGYLEQALLNFLMLLGWAPKKGETKEFFELDEFIKRFDIADLNKANPVFNREKLLWFNGEYIRKISLDEFVSKFIEWTSQFCQDDIKQDIIGDTRLKDKLQLVQSRVRLLADVVDFIKPFYRDPHFIDYTQVKGVKRYDKDTVGTILQEYLENFKAYNLDKISNDDWVGDVRSLADKFNMKHADLFMLIRLAVWGGPVSPPLFECLQILGKDKVVKRLERFKKYLGV